MMNDNSPHICPKCESQMQKQIGLGYMLIHGSINSENEIRKQIEERKERAKELKQKPIQRSHKGIGSGKGKAISGQHFEIDKQEFIKAAAKDPLMVKVAQDALKSKKYKKKNDNETI